VSNCDNKERRDYVVIMQLNVEQGNAPCPFDHRYSEPIFLRSENGSAMYTHTVLADHEPTNL
jgi:hypothetical protein